MTAVDMANVLDTDWRIPITSHKPTKEAAASKERSRKKEACGKGDPAAYRFQKPKRI